MDNNIKNNTEDEEYLKYVPWDKNEPSPTYTQRNTDYLSTPKRESAKVVQKPQALLDCLADVQPRAIDWLWPGRIALGKLTLIAGDPGLGKSLLTTALAAHISNGTLWPVDHASCPIGDTVLLSAEDDPADTIRPRLDAAGADCTRIHVLKAIRDKDEEGNEIQRMFSFKRDMERIEEVLSSLPDCRLLIIDPISAYLDGTDSNNNSDIRGLFAPLAELATRHGVAILAVSHLNKSAGGSAIYRTMGSLAFVAAARAAYVVTKDPDNQSRRLVLPVKNNLAKDSSGLAYSVMTAENGEPVIAWETEAVNITASDALAPLESSDERTDNDWAVLILRDILADGPKLVTEVNKDARSAGIREKTLRRAREKLGVQTTKSSFGGGWVLSLPEHEHAQGAQDTHSQKEGNFDMKGHLRDERITNE